MNDAKTKNGEVVLVVGATGVLGMEVCRQLRDQGREVRALVRPKSARKNALESLGVSIASGDLASPDALREACTGCSTIISTATAMSSTQKGNFLRSVDRDGQVRLVDVARSAGVGHFIYVSLSPNLRETIPLVRYKRQVERAIKTSGMKWTILQPSVFMDIWISGLLGWDFEKGKAMVFGSGTAPLSWISVRDVARYCVLATNDSRMIDCEIPLGGPDAIPPNDVVKLFENVSRRKYKVTRAPRPILALLSPIVSMFDDRKGSGMGLGAQCALGDLVGSDLQSELGLKLGTLREYAERVAVPL